MLLMDELTVLCGTLQGRKCYVHHLVHLHYPVGGSPRRSYGTMQLEARSNARRTASALIILDLTQANPLLQS